jgi:hypothetical protein
LAALSARVGGALAILLKVAAALPPTFLSGLGGALGIVLEVAAALLAAFLSGLGGTLAILGEVAGTSAMFCHDRSPSG